MSLPLLVCHGSPLRGPTFSHTTSISPTKTGRDGAAPLKLPPVRALGDGTLSVFPAAACSGTARDKSPRMFGQRRVSAAAYPVNAVALSARAASVIVDDITVIPSKQPLPDPHFYTSGIAALVQNRTMGKRTIREDNDAYTMIDNSIDSYLEEYKRERRMPTAIRVVQLWWLGCKGRQRARAFRQVRVTLRRRYFEAWKRTFAAQRHSKLGRLRRIWKVWANSAECTRDVRGIIIDIGNRILYATRPTNFGTVRLAMHLILGPRCTVLPKRKVSAAMMVQLQADSGAAATRCTSRARTLEIRHEAQAALDTFTDAPALVAGVACQSIADLTRLRDLMLTPRRRFGLSTGAIQFRDLPLDGRSFRFHVDTIMTTARELHEREEAHLRHTRGLAHDLLHGNAQLHNRTMQISEQLAASARTMLTFPPGTWELPPRACEPLTDCLTHLKTPDLHKVQPDVPRELIKFVEFQIKKLWIDALRGQIVDKRRREAVFHAKLRTVFRVAGFNTEEGGQWANHQRRVVFYLWARYARYKRDLRRGVITLQSSGAGGRIPQWEAFAVVASALQVKARLTRQGQAWERKRAAWSAMTRSLVNRRVAVRNSADTQAKWALVRLRLAFYNFRDQLAGVERRKQKLAEYVAGWRVRSRASMRLRRTIVSFASRLRSHCLRRAWSGVKEAMSRRRAIYGEHEEPHTHKPSSSSKDDAAWQSLIYLHDGKAHAVLIRAKSCWRAWAQYTLRRKAWSKLKATYARLACRHLQSTVFDAWSSFVATKRGRAGHSDGDGTFRQSFTWTRSPTMLIPDVRIGQLMTGAQAGKPSNLYEFARVMLQGKKRRVELSEDVSWAAASPDRQTIIRSMKQADLQRQEVSRAWTELHIAAQKYDTDAMRRLLENGADPNVQDEAGRTPLYIAASRCATATLRNIILLIGAGAHLLLLNDSGGSCIDECCNLLVQEVLLDHGRRILRCDLSRSERKLAQRYDLAFFELINSRWLLSAVCPIMLLARVTADGTPTAEEERSSLVSHILEDAPHLALASVAIKTAIAKLGVGVARGGSPQPASPKRLSRASRVSSCAAINDEVPLMEKALRLGSGTVMAERLRQDSVATGASDSPRHGSAGGSPPSRHVASASSGVDWDGRVPTGGQRPSSTYELLHSFNAANTTVDDDTGTAGRSGVRGQGGPAIEARCLPQELLKFCNTRGEIREAARALATGGAVGIAHLGSDLIKAVEASTVPRRHKASNHLGSFPTLQAVSALAAELVNWPAYAALHRVVPGKEESVRCEHDELRRAVEHIMMEEAVLTSRVQTVQERMQPPKLVRGKRVKTMTAEQVVEIEEAVAAFVSWSASIVEIKKRQHALATARAHLETLLGSLSHSVSTLEDV